MPAHPKSGSVTMKKSTFFFAVAKAISVSLAVFIVWFLNHHGHRKILGIATGDF